MVPDVMVRSFSASADNPAIDVTASSAGMFRLGAGSSALGSENNLICGSNFYGSMADPFDSWETRVLLGGFHGITSFEFRHCTFNGDNPNHPQSTHNGITTYYDLRDVKFCDCNFNAASTKSRGSKIVKSSNTNFIGPKMKMDANNTYAVGKTAALALVNSSKYEIVDLSGDCDVCTTID